MAGCRPEYFPLYMLAIEAMCEEPFNLYGVQATTHLCAPLVIVNGPVGREIGINSGHNAFGPGWRANATIGRALNLIVRNVGAFIPPYDGSHGLHGTMAAIEFAVLTLQVERIVVCGHSHCGAIRAAYEGAPDEAVALKAWLKLASEALLPVRPCSEALRRTEQRAVVLQLERLMGYPMVQRRVAAGKLTLHGWHYVIEDGEIHVFDAQQGDFLPASLASNPGTGPYREYVEHDGQILCD